MERDAKDEVKEESRLLYHRRPLNDRDFRFLRFCWEQYFVSRSQVAAWLACNYEAIVTPSGCKSAMIRMLKNLTGGGWLMSARPARLDYSEVFGVTGKGIAFLKERHLTPDGAGPVALDEAKIRHDRYVTDVRLAFELGVKDLDWTPERVLLEGRNEQVPDAVMGYLLPPRPKKSRIAIEVELTLKSRPRYEKKFAEYESGPYDWVFYFAGDPGIMQSVLDLSRDITGIVYVCLLDDLLRHRMETRLIGRNDNFPIGERFV